MFFDKFKDACRGAWEEEILNMLIFIDFKKNVKENVPFKTKTVTPALNGHLKHSLSSFQPRQMQ